MRHRCSASLGPGPAGPDRHGRALAAPEAGLLPQQDMVVFIPKDIALCLKSSYAWVPETLFL